MLRNVDHFEVEWDPKDGYVHVRFWDWVGEGEEYLFEPADAARIKDALIQVLAVAT